MKTFTVASVVLALTTLSSARLWQRQPHRRQNGCILPTVTNPNQNEVIASINQWNQDINTMDVFLTDVTITQTQKALASAQDELCQLMTLSSLSDLQGSGATAAFTCAVNDLMADFSTHVLTPLDNILSNPTSTSTVLSAVEEINRFRWCNFLGDASIIWQDAAEYSGVADQVNTVASFQHACASISCTNRCVGLDNGRFGTPGKIDL